MSVSLIGDEVNRRTLLERWGRADGGCFLSFIEHRDPEWSNPLDVVQAVAAEHGWPFEGTGGDEIALLVKGRCTDYQVFFTWMRPLELLHLACAFDLKVPEPRMTELQHLVAQINEHLWLGHFDLWTPDGTVVFRQALLLVGGVTASPRQCEVMLGTALDLCERHYPAFQLVLANGSASEAMDAMMWATAGEA
jgi:hypothetical protein